MLGNILEIIDTTVLVKLSIDINSQSNLVNLHVIFEDGEKKIVGEIININQTTMKVQIVGEIINNLFAPGINTKPSFKSNVRIIRLDELELILGKQELSRDQAFFGVSNIYDNYRINIGINDFFSNHFSILGNSGSGKSCSVASIFQSLFTNTQNPPLKSNMFFFDAFGEYTRAFGNLHQINPNINYKTYTTNTMNPDTEILRIPVWCLDVDDLALLLDVTTPNQLPIIEKTLKLVTIFPDLNLETTIAQPGYVRTLKQCLYIDKTGKMQEMELVTQFISNYITDGIENLDIDNNQNSFYTLEDLEQAMEFALISEGILKSEKVFDYANILSVRLHTLASGEYKDYFKIDQYITKEEYVQRLLTLPSTGGKCQ